MIKFAEIHKCIVNKLQTKFIDIQVKSTDTEDIIRPSFSIEFDNEKAEDFMDEALEKNLTVRIFYFANDRYKNKIENLNMKDNLTELFLENNILEINTDAKIQIEELKFDIVDGVLELEFDILVSEDYIKADTELMEDLEII